MQAKPIMIQGYYPRHMMKLLERALESFRVINIIGPRQVGKTTLVRNLFQKGEYITLDRNDILLGIKEDPLEQLRILKARAENEPVIIDEIQRSQNLSFAIKIIVDEDQRKGQFILTGSSNIFARRSVPDSLPGRVVQMHLWPLTVAEISRKQPSQLLDWTLQKSPSLLQINHLEELTRYKYIKFILEGGFPEPRELEIQERQKLLRNYLKNIVDRDVCEVYPLRKMDKFRKLINQIATRTAQEINRSELAKIIGVKWETIENYLDVMKQLSLVVQVDAWASSEAKREIKQPKFHFVDTGMNCALRRFNESSFDLGSPHATKLGPLLESFVFNEILRMLPYQSNDFRLYHWRSVDQREIDIIAEYGDQLTGIEVKAASTVTHGDFKHLKWFAKEGPGKSRQFKGIVFYLGDMQLSFGDNCFALPVSALWAEYDI